MEKIKAIREVHGLKVAPNDYTTFEGFEIETSQQKIHVLVADQGNCCESWGHVSTPDDLKEFLGANLRKIEVVDTALNKKEWDTQHPYGLDEGGVIFVNFETSRGLFQLAVYNSHNGCYGHTAKLISKQVTLENIL